MPSAFTYTRSCVDDIGAIAAYSQNKRIAAKDRKLAALARPELFFYFKRYQQFFQQPEKLFRNTALRKLSGFLYELYGSKAASFNYIKDTRDTGELGACLYCGLPKNITVDHYLPRDIKAFPHLSVLSSNLVPACSSCQNSKSNFFPRSIGGLQSPTKGARRAFILLTHRQEFNSITRPAQIRSNNRKSTQRIGIRTKRKNAPITQTKRIIHPYFDHFLNEVVFDLLLSWENDKPKVEKFVWKPNLSSAQRALLSYHLKKMHVKNRSAKPIERVHNAFVKALSTDIPTSEKVRDQATFMLTYYREKAGISNAIETAYFRALLLDERRIFLIANQLKAITLPLVSESKAKPI